MQKTKLVPRRTLARLNEYSNRETHGWVALLECGHAVVLTHHSDARSKRHECALCAQALPVPKSKPLPKQKVKYRHHAPGTRAAALHMVLDLGYTQSDVSAELDIPEGTLSKWVQRFVDDDGRPTSGHEWLKLMEADEKRVQAIRSAEHLSELRARQRPGTRRRIKVPTGPGGKREADLGTVLADIARELVELRQRQQSVENIVTRTSPVENIGAARGSQAAPDDDDDDGRAGAPIAELEESSPLGIPSTL